MPPPDVDNIDADCGIINAFNPIHKERLKSNIIFNIQYNMINNLTMKN